jgi:hypothetical protein
MDAVSPSKREPPILFDPLGAEYLADPYPFLASAASAAPLPVIVERQVEQAA